jgi:hypothetical protein
MGLKLSSDILSPPPSPYVKGELRACFKTYLAMIAYAEEHCGNSPTVSDLVRLRGLSWGTIHSHLKELQYRFRVIDYRGGKYLILDSTWCPPLCVPTPTSPLS